MKPQARTGTELRDASQISPPLPYTEEEDIRLVGPLSPGFLPLSQVFVRGFDVVNSPLFADLIVEVVLEGIVRMGGIPGVLDPLNLLDDHVRACDTQNHY